MITEIKTPDIPALPSTTQKEVKTAFVIMKDWARLVSAELNKRINNTVTLFYSIVYPKNNQALVYDETSGYWKNKYMDHSWLQGTVQADDTSSSTIGGKHVTDAMVKKYEDHRLITDGNPHGNKLSYLADVTLSTPTENQILRYMGGEWVNTDEVIMYAMNYDDVGGNIGYVGEAAPGSLTSAEVWRIQKIDTNSGDAVITWAGGNSDFVNKWDDRLTLVYT